MLVLLLGIVIGYFIRPIVDKVILKVKQKIDSRNKLIDIGDN